jgi:hypothetical protein
MPKRTDIDFSSMSPDQLGNFISERMKEMRGSGGRVTRFRVFRGQAGNTDPAIQDANDFIAEIESNGGKYVDSHSAISQAPNGVIYMLTVVYQVPEGEPGIL